MQLCLSRPAVSISNESRNMKGSKTYMDDVVKSYENGAVDTHWDDKDEPRYHALPGFLQHSLNMDVFLLTVLTDEEEIVIKHVFLFTVQV